MAKPASLLTRSIFFLSVMDYSGFCAAEVVPPHSGRFVLDSSQQVFFDQYQPYSFSQQLLQDKNKFNRLAMVVGGSAELDLQTWKGDRLETVGDRFYSTGNGLYLTQAQLDFMSNINSWSSLFLSVTNAHVEAQSNYVFTQHAFVLLGNFDKSPLYLTLGINTIPFGQFSPSGPWNAPLTGAYFNPLQAPQVSLGYYKYDLNAIVTTYDDSVNHNQNYAYALYYDKTNGLFSYKLGVGYLSDLKTNAAGTNTTKRVAKKDAPKMNMGGIWDYNAALGYNKVLASGEIVFGNKNVGGHNSPPQALGFVLTYTPHILGGDTAFALGYSISMNLRDIPTTLMGYDTTPSTTSGLKKDWSFNVSRSLMQNRFQLALDAEKAVTYSGKTTYAYTLDMTAYL